MTALTYPEKLPADGKRVLSGPEAMMRNSAMECMDADHPTACTGQVHVGIFFDGTGNNRDWPNAAFPDTGAPPGYTTTNQVALGRHSNVVRLYNAYKRKEVKGRYAYYVPGLGTPNLDVGDTWLYGAPGGGFGYKGADRINWGIVSIFNAMHSYLAGSDLIKDEAQRDFVNSISSKLLSSLMLAAENDVRWSGLTDMEERLAAVVKNHQRKIKNVRVSVYGFSRGAAQARAFAHWLEQITERNDHGRTLAGVPLRVTFMGIFDTVASVGAGDMLPLCDGHNAWGNGTQSIAPIVERCVHYAALHEQRASFPVEAGDRGENVGYPGMHSDVGGGYRPGEQGKAMAGDGSEMLSQIPLVDMHFAAIKAAEPLMTLDDPEMSPRAKKDMTIAPSLVPRYNEWLSSHGVPAGDFESVTQQHTAQLIRWRALMAIGWDGAIEQRPFYARAANVWADHTKLLEATEEFRAQLTALAARNAADPSKAAAAGRYAKNVATLALKVLVPSTDTSKMEWAQWPLSADEKSFLSIATAPGKPPAASIELFDNYVHDSRAGFFIAGSREFILLCNGYLRYRTVFNPVARDASSQPHARWASYQLTKGAMTAANAVSGVLARKWEETTSMYEAIHKRIKSMMRTSISQAEAAADATTTAYRDALEQAQQTYEQIDRDLTNELLQNYPRPR
jgi:ribosomal protein S20